MKNNNETKEGYDFIGDYDLLDMGICDEIIKYFEDSKEKFKGIINSSQGIVHDPKIKDCTEVILSKNSEIYERYMAELQLCVNQYIQKYPHCNQFSPWGIIDIVKIKKYEPGQAYFQTHCERGSATYPNSTRHLVWMTYLNDVQDQGGTEFIYQNKVFCPKKGSTLIWPVDWTHVHRGIPSPSETKYIVGGWFNFLE